MKITTFRTDAHLQDVFAELKVQIETALGAADFAERRDAATATMIAVRRNRVTGNIGYYVWTAGGYEMRFASTRNGEVLFYASDHFAMRLLETWARENKELSRAAALEAACPDFCAEREDYCDTPSADRREYVSTMGEMFGACREAALDVNDREAMIAAICELLKISVSSRKQLTPYEMRVVKLAAEEGCFARDWSVRRRIVKVAA